MTSTPVEAAVTTLTQSGSALTGHAAEAKRLLDRHENVVLYGPPGTGKSRAAEQLARWWEANHGTDSVFRTTFHPSYSYEDFIEGFRPDPTDPANFVPTDGILFEAAKHAESEPTLLVIDEINRADVARAFGELITYVEHDKRDIEFTTAQRPLVKRHIPADLYLLGTMNTADKSISLLDVALRRRFKFIDCPPDPTVFAGAMNWKDKAFGIDLGDLLTAINNALLRSDISRDRLVGQALLSVSAAGDDSELFDRLQYDVYPLIEEYLFGDPVRMADVLPGLIDEYGGLDRLGLTEENVRSWLPQPGVGDHASDESQVDSEHDAAPGA